MRVLDLFSGTGGASQAFVDRGHDVTRVDNDPQFADVPYTIIGDVLDTFDVEPGAFDVVWASVPCQAFSLSSVRHHFLATAECGNCAATVVRLSGEEWQECCGKFRMYPNSLHMEPKSEFGKLSLKLVERTLELIEQIQPRWWWLENPRATLQHFVPFKPVTVWYCRYGDTSAKPTHLFGQWPDTWTPRPECHNGNPDHQAARRGSLTGTQGKKGAALRAVVPYELSEEVCKAVESAI